MAEQKKHKHDDAEFVEVEPVKQIEVETKDLVVSSKLFIYLIIGLLAYLIFLVIPSIEDKSVIVIQTESSDENGYTIIFLMFIRFIKTI